jgi:hypothetical protein
LGFREAAMRVPRDARFDEERQRFGFRGCCEECVLFLPEKGSCAGGYPNWEHRRSYLDTRTEDQHVVFCKEFELA